MEKLKKFDNFLNENFYRSNKIEVGNDQYTSKDKNGEILKVGDFVSLDNNKSYYLRDDLYQIYTIDGNGNIRICIPKWSSPDFVEKIK
jgi:hypothetical protein